MTSKDSENRKPLAFANFLQARRLNITQSYGGSPNVLSPVTDLVLNLGNLSTENYMGATPKRRFSWNSTGTPTPDGKPDNPIGFSLNDSSDSVDASPLNDLTTRHERTLKENNRSEPLDSQTTSGLRNRVFMRKLKSLPVYSDKENDDENSVPSSPTCPPLARSSPIRAKYPGQSPTGRGLSERNASADGGRKLSLSGIPPPLLPLGADEFNSDSQDSGYNGPSNDNNKVVFVEPTGLAPRRCRYNSSGEFLLSSPGADSPSRPALIGRGENSPGSLSTVSEICSRSSSNAESDQDDGFLEIQDDDLDLPSDADDMPAGMGLLLNGPMPGKLATEENRRESVVSVDSVFSPESDYSIQPSLRLKSCSRGLFRDVPSPESPTFAATSPFKPPAEPAPTSKAGFKRLECPRDFVSPVQNKRRKATSFCCRISENKTTPMFLSGTSVAATNVVSPLAARSTNIASARERIRNSLNTASIPMKSPLSRCHSESEATIKRAVQISSQQLDLIGDCTRKCALPLCNGRHQDLKCISVETVSQLLSGDFSENVNSFLIVDCRYPYEFEGGHISGAMNVYTNEAVMETFFKAEKLRQYAGSSSPAIIFHCEFSSERGPKMCRFLRNKDREVNTDNYPALHYPEIYLMEGGYKAFFERFKVQCLPMEYKPMTHKDHESDLKHFRAKSRSWTNENKGGRYCTRAGLKF